MITEWTCHICGKMRPDAKISVLSKDVLPKYNMPPNTKENIRYCNDNPDCIAKTPKFSFFKK